MSTIASRVRERRSFFSRLAAGAAVFGSTLLRGDAASAQTGGTSVWKPGRHTQDDWLDQIPGSHRFVIDTTSPQGFGNALLFANNFFVANQAGYGLGNADCAVVIVARHNSTPFAYVDGIWAKYGMPIGDAAAGFDDPKTKTRPMVNVFNSTDRTGLLPNGGVTVDSLIARGVHFAVCQMATRRFAGAIASARGLNTDTVYNELAANLVKNSHLAPAGIVAVNRAQERGYSFANAG